MAKKDKGNAKGKDKPNVEPEKPPKKLSELSTADLKQRSAGLDDKIKQAAQAGNVDRVSKLEDRQRTIDTRVIERKAGVAQEQFKSKADVVAFIKNDPRYKLLSPEQQKAMEVIVDNYSYSEMDASTLSKNELKAITNYAARIMDPYYDQKKKDINQEYEVGLANTIEDLNTGLERSQEALTKALESNDQALIEQTTQKINQIKQALPFYQQSLDEFVTFKRSYLEEQIKAAKADVEQGIGRADADALLSTRQQERNYNKQLKDLEQNMRSRGYAWSEERTDEEKVLGEENVDILSSITNTRERSKMDAVRAAENAFGSDAVAQVQGASPYLRGGVTGSSIMTTDYDIQDALDNYQMTVAKEIANAETLLGTAKLKELYGDQYSNYMTGGIEGGFNTTARQNRDAANTTYQQGAEDAVTEDARAYGSEAVAAGIQPNTGVAIPTGVGYRVGAAGRQRNQHLRAKQFVRTGAIRTFVDQEKLARQSTYQA